jgi:hypothetical protein
MPRRSTAEPADLDEQSVGLSQSRVRHAPVELERRVRGFAPLSRQRDQATVRLELIEPSRF